MSEPESDVVAETTARFLPPVACAPWCKDGTGHSGAAEPDDQWCSTIAFPVQLSTEQPVLWSDGVLRAAQTTVQVVKDPGESPHLSFEDASGYCTRYTPEEAEAQARVWQHAAWVARQTF